ncbi:hypothetical protein QJS10_CPB20g01046 [Acorus calamus]|uniref:Uncharacterized protein n=1 Tax=Acorus calamus TaxID=4465 RepID=A0AAV9CCY9_ACOCL|nr:hypothetical protein QJS10_CPB20g01046 [Acorus calamus]
MKVPSPTLRTREQASTPHRDRIVSLTTANEGACPLALARRHPSKKRSAAPTNREVGKRKERCAVAA